MEEVGPGVSARVPRSGPSLRQEPPPPLSRASVAPTPPWRSGAHRPPTVPPAAVARCAPPVAWTLAPSRSPAPSPGSSPPLPPPASEAAPRAPAAPSRGAVPVLGRSATSRPPRRGDLPWPTASPPRLWRGCGRCASGSARCRSWAATLSGAPHLPSLPAGCPFGRAHALGSAWGEPCAAGSHRAGVFGRCFLLRVRLAGVRGAAAEAARQARGAGGLYRARGVAGPPVTLSGPGALRRRA